MWWSKKPTILAIFYKDVVIKMPTTSTTFHRDAVVQGPTTTNTFYIYVMVQRPTNSTTLYRKLVDQRPTILTAFYRDVSVRGAPWSAANRLHGQRTGVFLWRPVLGLSRKTDQFRLNPTQNCAPGWWCDRV